jgi:hypothetical protein
MNDLRFTLKDEDRAADPQSAGIELLDALRTISADAVRLRDQLARTPGLPRRAMARAVDLAEDAGRACDDAEALMRAVRAAGLVSLPYSEVSRGR